MAAPEFEQYPRPMNLRAIPDSMDPAVVGAIDAELDRICHEHRASVRLAIESASCARGFPSLDSDYDCRFVYVASLETYLSPWGTRDVIETPLAGLLDVNASGTVRRWSLRSRRRDELRALADQVADRNRIARHYVHLGQQHWRLFGDNGSLKKVFYSPHRNAKGPAPTGAEPCQVAMTQITRTLWA